MCTAHSKRLQYSLTQQHKAQEHKQQVTNYELLILEILCVFVCVINNFPNARNAFPIVVGGRWCEIEYLVGAVRTTKIRHARTNRKQLGICIFGNESRYSTEIVAKSSASILVTMPGFIVFYRWPSGTSGRYRERQPLQKCVKSSLCK